MTRRRETLQDLARELLWLCANTTTPPDMAEAADLAWRKVGTCLNALSRDDATDRNASTSPYALD